MKHSDEIAINAENIKKVFNAGTKNELLALNGLSLIVHKGDFITIIGSNGAGKTTLLNTIAGSVQIDDGKILFDGRNFSDLPEHKRAKYIGRVFQDPLAGTAPGLTISENLALALRKNRFPTLRLCVSSRNKKEFEELLAELGLGLEKRINDKIETLSGGERQALTLLMAIASRPQILLLDEHTASLDPQSAEIIMNKTVDFITSFGLSTLMVTHNIQLAQRYGNRMLMMHRGRIIFDVTGEKKSKLTIFEIISKFKELRGTFIRDKAILTE